MGCDQNAGTSLGGISDNIIDDVAPGLIEPGVGLVEQPQLGLAGGGHCQSDASALASGELAHKHTVQTIIYSESAGGRIGECVVDLGQATPEPEIFSNREVVVQHRSMTHEANLGTNTLTVIHEVMAEYLGGAGLEGKQTRTEPQQGGFARAVRSLKQHGLASGNVKRRAGQCRKPTEQHYSVHEGENRHVKTLPRRTPDFAVRSQRS